jgi:cbb3-type cytochrome oxidase cytochrome c subunit
MPDSTELIESHKHVMMISVTGKVKIVPEFCDHSKTVTIKAGHEYTILGEREDNTECYEQCTLCGSVLRDDGSWGATLKCDDEKEIPY